MTSESGSYDQATILRKQKMAEAMLGDAMKMQPIRHWAQGLAQLGQAGVAGLSLRGANQEAQELKQRERSELMAALMGGASPGASDTAPQTPFPTSAASQPLPNTGPVTPPVNQPRPEVMPSPKVWGDKEAVAAGLYPTGGTQVASLSTPKPEAPQAPAQSPVQAPATAQGGGVLSGVPASSRAQIAALLTSDNPMAKQLGGALLQQAIKPHDYNYQTLPDGTILRMDPRGGKPEPVYSAQTKPTWGVIDETDGKKTYGWIDPVKRTADAVAGSAPPPKNTVTGPDGKEIPIPAGQDRKKFIEHVTTATADAAVGKRTEVQQKADQFASRMEQAEKNIASVESEGLGISGAAQQIVGGTPVIGSALQTKNYQKFDQAKSAFITAVLRQESGAAISKEEFRRYEKEFFPQPGDDPDTVIQKRMARKTAAEAMRRGAGVGSKPVETDRKTKSGVSWSVTE